jgi:hypothetical protein
MRETYQYVRNRRGLLSLPIALIFGFVRSTDPTWATFRP